MNDGEVFMADIARVYGFAIKRKSFLIEMLQRELLYVGISHWDGQVLPIKFCL